MTAKLENWAVFTNASPYTPPELTVKWLVGNVYNHPDKDRFPDGKMIETSYIKGIEGEAVKTNSGSLYLLGEPKPEYAKEYPNPKERLSNSI